jgi:DNA repair protein RadC
MNDKLQFWQDLKSGRFASMVKESARGQRLSNSREAYNVLKPMLAENDDIEKVYVIFLDAQNKILAIEKMFSGSITAASIYNREIVKRLIQLKASAFVMAHNHPSADTTPSAEDKYITIKIGIAAASIDVAFHDHIIIGDGYYSMADNGWLKEITNKFSKLLRAKPTAMEPIKTKKNEYACAKDLRRSLRNRSGKELILYCGHSASLGQFIGNNVTILNGAKLKIICAQCGY